MSSQTHSNNNFTMDDIALELGISKSTVSRALAGSSRISVETRKKVEECAKAHNFRPNLTAKALAGKKTLNLAAVMPFEATAVQMMFFHECLSGIVKRASDSGYSVLVCMTGENDEDQLEQLLLNSRVDAVILTQLKHDDKNVKILKNEKFPFVVIGSGAGKDVAQVDSKMKENCADFTEQCVKKIPAGGKVLFICGTLDVEANNNRLSGFLSGMEKAGIESENVKYAVLTDSSEIDGGINLKDWEMILCSDDVVCTKVLELARKNHLEVGAGKDFMLASFHDSVLLESNVPPVTALRVNALNLGEKACDVALKMISDGGEKIELENYVDCSFEFRESL